MATALCFDLDRTLLRYDRDPEAIARVAFERALDTTANTVVEAAIETTQNAIASLDPEPYRQGVVAACEQASVDADPDAVVATLREVTYEHTAVAAATRRSLEALAADEQTRMGVITNGPPEWQRGKLRHHGLESSIDAVVTSYEAGAHKPDSAPFDLARERLPAEEYVMVGDDYAADVEGARAAGFVPIHYEADGPDFWTTLEAML